MKIRYFVVFLAEKCVGEKTGWLSVGKSSKKRFIIWCFIENVVKMFLRVGSLNSEFALIN